MTAHVKEAALAGATSLGNSLLDGNTRENSQTSRILQPKSSRDLIAMVSRSRANTALADAMRAALEQGCAQ